MLNYIRNPSYFLGLLPLQLNAIIPKTQVNGEVMNMVTAFAKVLKTLDKSG